MSGDGRPVKTPAPSWSIVDVLPCISSAAPTMRRAVGVGDGLVAEAHAEDGDAAVGELGHRGADDAGVLRPTRAGRQQHAVGLEGERAGDVELVVAVHDRLRPELAEVLDEVVDEAVVAVDDEHPRPAHGRASYAAVTGSVVERVCR